MKTTRDFRPLSDRYSFDCGPCSYANGFAQIDTRQDASYYGSWASPTRRTIVNFCEGDVTTTVCESDEEFVSNPERWLMPSSLRQSAQARGFPAF